MWHAILGGLMLACAVITTLFVADALEQLGQAQTGPSESSIVSLH
jgi:hypothetical protein